ncbi:MAG: cytochrome c oxidase subunit II [Pseudomonadota bacterium]|nr:cytochrome c oxidase subunit II [Pseudomonadota bacterium]
MKRVPALVTLFTLCAFLAGCEGAQSMFTPMAAEAERIVLLFFVMLAGAAAIFVFVFACLWFACRGSDGARRRLGSESLVFRLGLLFPIVVLTVLLLWGFRLLGLASGSGAEPELVVRVEGEQWWWRVSYVLADGSVVESANEVRVPIDTDVLLELTTADVLHSFWIPAWAGKLDMIPGRTNLLQLRLSTAGVVQGQCAEYCGGAHALMGLYGVAMERADFDAWLAREVADAAATSEADGRRLFIASGCGGCHRVRGEDAPGRDGPDLTHVGSRYSIGAGLLPNGVAELERWIARHPVLKPENRMPPFDFLTDAERAAIARYLSSLE